MPKQSANQEKLFLFLWVSLALSGLASWRALITARASGDRTWAVIFAWLCVLLLLVTVHSVAVSLIRRFERRKVIESAPPFEERDEYVAAFSAQDRAVATILVTAFALIGLYLYTRPEPLIFRCVSAGILAGLLWVAWRFWFTEVRFAGDRITARIFPFVCYSASYSDILSVRIHPGNLRIRFLNGRVLNLWSGPGDPARITGILSARVEIAPEIVRWPR